MLCFRRSVALSRTYLGRGCCRTGKTDFAVAFVSGFLVSMLTEPDTAPSGYAVYGGGRAFNQLCEADLHARRALRAIHSCQAVYAELARIKLITTEIQTGQRVAFAAKLSNGSVFFGYGIH